MTTYDPTVFARGQRYRAHVIQQLAQQRIDFYRLPTEVDAGEIVRRCFYTPMSVEYCVDLIKAANCSSDRFCALIIPL